MNIQKIKALIEQLDEIDTYKVDIDSDAFLYVERDVDGDWVNAFSVQCIVDELKKEFETSPTSNWN